MPDVLKNTTGQSLTLYAVNATTGLPVTGDAANQLFYVSIDDGSVTAIAANSGVPTEVDATNAKGLYKIALAQGETNGNKLLFTGKSSTANVVLVPTVIYTDPSNYTATAIDSSGRGQLTAGAIDVPQLTPTLLQILTERVDVTGAATPAVADTYIHAGFYNFTKYYQSTTLNPPMYLWQVSGNQWAISSVLGTEGAAYFANLALGPFGNFTPQGTATGNPTSQISSAQLLDPHVPLNIGGLTCSGSFTLNAGLTVNQTAANTAAVIITGSGSAPGVVINAGNTSGAAGVVINASTLGNSSAIVLVPHGTGVGLAGSIAGNITGNLSGSVGSISGVSFPTGFSSLTTAAISSAVAGQFKFDGSGFVEANAEVLPSPAPSGYGPGAGAGTTAVTDLAGGSNRSPSIMTVQTSGGSPIQGATVTAYNAAAYASNPATATVLQSTTTNSLGGWTLNLPTGEGICTLVFAYPGDQTATGNVTV